MSYAAHESAARATESKRTVLHAVLASIAVVVGLGALAAGGYAYHHQVNHVSSLKAERSDLKAQLASSQAKLLTTQLKLGTRVRALNKAKANLTQMSKELVAAKKRADQSYSAGYSSGSSSGYTNGYSEGNSSGYSNGLYAGSDQLTCSDDPDVTWLPYCG